MSYSVLTFNGVFTMALKRITESKYNELCSVNKDSKEYVVDYLVKRLENEKNGLNTGRSSMITEKKGQMILTLKYSNKTFDRFEYEGKSTINDLISELKSGNYDKQIEKWLEKDRQILVENLKVARANKKK